MATKIKVDELLKSAEEAIRDAKSLSEEEIDIEKSEESEEEDAAEKGGMGSDDDDEDEDEEEEKPSKGHKKNMKNMRYGKAGKAKKGEKIHSAQGEEKKQPDPGSRTEDVDEPAVPDEYPFDEDEEDDEGKERTRGKKSLTADPEILKGYKANAFLKGLVDRIDSGNEANAGVQAALVKGVAALIKANVALSQQVQVLTKSLSSRVDRLERQPVGRTTTATRQSRAPERFPSSEGPRTMTMKSAADKLATLAMKGDIEITPMDVARALRDLPGLLQSRPHLREKLGLEDAA